MSRKILIIICMSLLLTGCVRRVVSQPLAPSALSGLPYSTNIDDAEIKLAEAAVSVSKSLTNLSAIERAQHPCVRLPCPFEGPNMCCLASVDWVGPIEPLLMRIADATHYRLRVLGREPAIPVIVTMTARDVPFGDILRDISLQAHKKACLCVYPRSRVIELRYVV